MQNGSNDGLITKHTTSSQQSVGGNKTSKRPETNNHHGIIRVTVSAAGAGKIGAAVGFPEGTSGNGDFETRPWRLKASLKTASQASDVLPTASRPIFPAPEATASQISQVQDNT